MNALFLQILSMSLAASGLILAVIFLRVLFKSAPRWMHVLNYKKPSFWLVIAMAAVGFALAVFFLTNPIAQGDYFVLTSCDSSAGTNWLSYEVQLDHPAMGGEIYVEHWVGGTCVRSEPVAVTRKVGRIDIIMRGHHKEGAYIGEEIQIETDQAGGSLQTYLECPADQDIQGWGFNGYELEEKVTLSPESEVILAAKVFDTGRGVRVFGCKTLSAEPERLQNAENMIVVRAVFHSE